MQNNLLIKNLKVAVGKKKNKVTLFDSFNFEFAKGKVYFIIGPAGVGKTTLISHFNGLKRAKQGDIFIKDKAILSNKRKIKDINEIRKQIQLVFQFPENQLFKNTVIKDVAYGPINFKVSKDKANILARKYLAQLGLDSSTYELSPFVLSNGQKRKVAIAGILAIEPDIFIFDEPTVGLDPQSEVGVINLITQLKKQGHTVIVVSHNTDNALAIADEILLLHNKKLLAYGKPYEILSDIKLMNLTSTKVPNVIVTLNLLKSKSSKFAALTKLEPKTVDELANAINSLMKGGNHE